MILEPTPASIVETLSRNADTMHANTATAGLVRLSRERNETELTKDGALAARTGKFTGRSPKDKYIVGDATTNDTVWWGNNGRMERDKFDLLLNDLIEHGKGKTLFRQQLFAGADPDNRMAIDVVSESAWHALFIRHLLIRPGADELAGLSPDVCVVHLPSFKADPARHGTRTSTCIALDLTRNIVLICGSYYAGEIKKSVFSLYNFHAPERDVFPMHCSANVGPKGDTTIFFGLSGTGKTTLSTSADRSLVGDDEHGWGPHGVFNLEGGCYAKAINLSEKTEPEIFAAARQPGSILENVVLKEDGTPDYDDDSLTENTRIAYTLSAIPNRVDSGLAPAPRNVVLLAADAFGVLPPLAKLTPKRAIYFFLSGYTAKLAGTERGITEPEATFSACFGAPFLAQFPAVYGRMLAKRLATSGATCWLLNTGWSGGAYGVGKRMSLPVTRRLLSAAIGGELDEAEFVAEPYFGLWVPKSVEGVDDTLLLPEQTWADKDAYKATAARLSTLFDENFARLGADAAQVVADGVAKSYAA
ncbi:MAG: phosphoenolpyruvate carboxykinase (ATP) [Alphaproteobacteria bacterium]|nr:phosphoenolpyruvate carboxykinase (ATP) [Alphaproteobacteria bacterium]